MRARAVALAMAAALALAAAAGCKSTTPGAVDLTIIADPSLSDATVAAIGVIDVSVSGAASVAQPYVVSGAFGSGRQERLVIRPPVTSGMLTITVLARSAAGDALAYGQTNVTLQPSRSTSATVTLTGDVPMTDGGAEPPDMTTVGPSLGLVAGHIGGVGYADGPAAVARYNNPRGVVFLGGNLYVADMYNHVIRQIALASGTVSTLAGSALKAGSSDGTGAAARFNRPTALATDGTNLYVSDLRNCTIRQISLPAGAVTTLAGTAGSCGAVDGSGSAARFDHPHGLTCDGAGNLYIADNYNHDIRKLVLSSGAVSVFAGTAGSRGFMDGTGTAARFSAPHGLAFDNGNLYVADSGNQAIRQIVISSQVVSTPFGTGQAGGFADAVGAAARFNSPRGIVADGNGNLFVTDSNNGRVRKIVESTGAVTTLAGHDAYGSLDGVGAGAGFALPFGIAVDASGNLLVTESFGYTIRQVTAAGVVTTMSGLAGGDGIADGVGAAALFERPHGLCADGNTLYVADKMNNVIRKVDPASGTVITVAGSSKNGSADGVGALASFAQPFACVADGAGKLYVSDADNATIRVIDLATRAVTTLAGSAGKTGTTDGVGAAARFNTPAGLALANGTLYVADLANHTIRAIVLSSATVSTFAGTAGAPGSVDAVGTAAKLNKPNGLALDGNGNLYVADQQNSTIRKIVLSSAAVSTIAGAAGTTGSLDGNGTSARFWNPHAVAADGNGNLYVADTLNHTLRKIVLATGDVSTIAGVPALASIKLGAVPGALNTPAGVAVGAGGAIYLTSAHENAVLVVR